MLNKYARGFFGKLFTPLARVLIRMGVSPDAVTIIGTLGVCVGALVFYPLGELFWGTVFITAFVFADMVDGLMARMLERSSRWGNFLDSTLDRLADGAVFAGVAIWFFTGGENPAIAVFALVCLLLGSLVSYARAKAESLGCTAAVGFAERSERLVAVLVFTGLTGLGLPEIVLLVVLVLLAAASLVTVIQRIMTVYRQTRLTA
ncbi:phosphatidylinositol phosphate synthase [Arthrobacter sulfonylureivorans]|uniref:Phosphatidylinositol phosphate synthase n=1 Tax=Arthrobacter sulfonylureivorans TaxID=2486855 RepID=A0ABY3W2N8_9MICC|nr:CDP-alcohol phosphatidyltransferase family protein [Arthrobacter sulfonylureivorans]UNK44304.1 CDP-alcohol phosphatidyltransferase family protein [Arthrobacter sulfonylureivorans]